MIFLPERLSQLKDRLHDALIDEINVEDGVPMTYNRDHIFDYDDNMRMVITRSADKFYVMASPAGGAVFKKATVDEVVKNVISRAEEIGLMGIIGTTDIQAIMKTGGALHLIISPGTGKVSVDMLSLTTGTGYGE